MVIKYIENVEYGITHCFVWSMKLKMKIGRKIEKKETKKITILWKNLAKKRNSPKMASELECLLANRKFCSPMSSKTRHFFLKPGWHLTRGWSRQILGRSVENDGRLAAEVASVRQSDRHLEGVLHRRRQRRKHVRLLRGRLDYFVVEAAKIGVFLFRKNLLRSHPHGVGKIGVRFRDSWIKMG